MYILAKVKLEHKENSEEGNFTFHSLCYDSNKDDYLTNMIHA